MYNPLISWLGIIEYIKDDTVYCILYENCDNPGTYEIMERNFNLFPEEFSKHITIGRAFNMTIGKDILGNPAIEFEVVYPEEVSQEQMEEARKKLDSVLKNESE